MRPARLPLLQNRNKETAVKLLEKIMRVAYLVVQIAELVISTKKAKRARHKRTR